MKKTFLQHIPSLSILIIGFFLCVASGNVQAQTLAANDQLTSVPKGPFVSPATAITRLESELIKLKTEMHGLPHSSPVYKQANWKFVYYTHMVSLLSDAKTTASDEVAVAIVRGLGIYATDLYGDISFQQKVINKKTAVDLLKV